MNLENSIMKNLFKTKLAMSVLCMALVSTYTMADNYQPLNPGFEGTWDNTTKEPEHWHGFATVNAKGIFAMAKNTDQLVASTTEVHSGTYAAKISANKVFSVIAQGNLTTGRINGSSMSATDANGNYNYMDPAEPDYTMPFCGKPDSMVVWTKFVPEKSTDKASIGCQLIRNMRYQTPTVQWKNNGINVTAADVVIAEAINDNIAAQSAWTRMSMPFVYDNSGDTPSFIMITATTNNTPGKGGAKDVLYVDDFEMIYNSELVSVTVDGNVFDAAPVINTGLYYGDNQVTDIITNAQAGTTECIFDDVTCSATITVKGNDYSVNPSNVHSYTLQFLSIPTGWEDMQNIHEVKRIIRDGRVLIQRDGRTYDILGNLVY